MSDTHLKARNSRTDYLQSSVGIIAGSGRFGSRLPDFNHRVSIAEFNGWVYAAATINAERAASVPLRLYIRKRPQFRRSFEVRSLTGLRGKRLAYLKGDSAQQPSISVMRKAAEFDDFEEVIDNHPIYDLLDKVNPWMNGSLLRVLHFIYLELTGNSYLHPIISPQTGIPSELWPMPSQWVDIVPGEKGSDVFIKGYAYGLNGIEKQIFEDDEVIHTKYPNPRNLYYGLGKVEAGWPILMKENADMAMDLALAQNHARPDYAVLVENASPDALSRLENQINEKFMGSRKSGKMLTVSGKVNIVPLAWPPKDMGGRDETIEQIAAVFRVPITKLKANDPNRANAEQGNYGWLDGTILPMLRYDEQELNESLLPLFGIDDDAFLAYDNPVPENLEIDHRFRIEDANTGLLTINEARQRDGLAPYDSALGDVPRYNGVPIDKLGQSADQFGGLFTGLAQRQQQEPAAQTSAPVTPQQPAAQDVQVAQSSVLNGAQVSAATAIVTAVAKGDIPRDAGIGQLVVLFNLNDHQAERIMGSAGNPKIATTPNYNPAEHQAAPAATPETVAPAKTIEKNAGPHKRSSAQVQVEGETGQAVLSLASRIPDDVLANDGRESEPHITVLYGFETDDPQDIAGLVSSFGSVKVTLGKIEKFTADEHDVIYVGIQDRGLHDLREAVSSAPHTNTHPEYIPHCTLAYVKPGSCDAMLGRDDLAGKAIDITSMTFSDSTGKRTVLSLGAEIETKAIVTMSHKTILFGQVKATPDDTIRTDEKESAIQTFARRIHAIMLRQLGDVVDALPKLSGTKSLEDDQKRIEAIVRSYADEMLKTIEESLTVIVGTAGDEALKAVISNGVYNVSNPEVAKFLNDYTIRLAGAVNDVTIDQLSRTLADGMTSGESVSELATRVRALDQSTFGPLRAEAIARTESARAYVQGSIEGWDQSGVIIGKQWELAADACPFCQEIAAQFNGKTIGLRENFLSLGQTLVANFDGEQKAMAIDYADIGGAPLHPNCRCGVVPILAGEAA